VTDWLALCRAAGEDVRRAVAELPTRAEREPVLRTGEGGDDTTAIDEAAEAAVLPHFRDLPGVSIVSEEIGLIGDGATLVVIDPIDGSLNAKRGLPYFAVSIAIAEGPTMADVVVGYVLDLANGEEWTAERGRGAFLDGRRLGGEAPKDEIELLAFEATLTSTVAQTAGAMEGIAQRLRVMGSLALSLCHLAAGRLDGVVSLKPARSVDIAAGQLLVREAGLAIELPDEPPFGAAPLDLKGRSRVVAAGTTEACRRLATALP
jgi:myo-inositol-1(or 4)-monophosphatase